MHVEQLVTIEHHLTLQPHIQKASAHVFAPHLADGKGLVTGFTFPFDTAVHGIITHVSSYRVAFVRLPMFLCRLLWTL